MKKKQKLESFMFYSLISLPYEKRAMPGFRHPSEGTAETLALFQSYGIFFYRDNVTHKGLVLSQPALAHVTSPQGFILDEPVQAYMYRAECVAAKNGIIQVATRKLDEVYTAAALNLQKLRSAKYGDALWWDKWGIPVWVKSVTPFTVECVK